MEAQALAEEVGPYGFLICSVVWCDILLTTRSTNRFSRPPCNQMLLLICPTKPRPPLQSTDNLVLSEHRPLPESCVKIWMLSHNWNKNGSGAQKGNLLTRLLMSHWWCSQESWNFIFNVAADSALGSSGERLPSLSEVQGKFGVVLKFNNVQKISNKSLNSQCAKVERPLSCNGESDINGLEMTQDNSTGYAVFKPRKATGRTVPQPVDSLSAAVTLPVIAASTERSFSKLKLITMLLRSAMGQARLSGLAVIGVNREPGRQVTLMM